jgi:AAA15 family ATPase/GTPase
MIINFSVQNFGSIKEKQTLSFEANKSTHLEEYYIIEPIPGLRLNKLALIYGANASGKTTVLKALDFLRKICTEPFNTKTEKFDFEPFLFDENTPTENTKFELEFVQNKIKYFYEVELNKTHIVREKLLNYNPNKAVVFERTTNEEKELTSIKFGSKINKRNFLENSLDIFTLWNNTVLGGILKANIDDGDLFNFLHELRSISPLINDSKIDNFTSELVFSKKVKKNVITNILKKADFKIRDFTIDLKTNDEISTRNKYAVTFSHHLNNVNYDLPFESESQGTQRYYGFSTILLLLLSTDCIFSIDELESSLHPDLYIHFLLTFLVNSRESQLIATTHNREILNNRDIFRDDAIWFTEKDENSATELYSLADFDSSVIRDKSNVLNAYKSGKLGAVPNLGDYYIDLEDES